MPRWLYSSLWSTRYITTMACEQGNTFAWATHGKGFTKGSIGLQEMENRTDTPSQTVALPRGNYYTSHLCIGCKSLIIHSLSHQMWILSTYWNRFSFIEALLSLFARISFHLNRFVFSFQCQIPESFINSRKNSAIESMPSSQSTSSSKPEERRKKRGGSLRKFHRMLPKLPTDK